MYRCHLLLGAHRWPLVHVCTMAQGLAATPHPANAPCGRHQGREQHCGCRGGLQDCPLSLCLKPYAHAAHATPLPADITVSSGTVDVAVAYRGLPIYTEEKDLCDRTKCPVQPGPLSLKYEQYLPSIAPPVSCCSTLCTLCSCRGLPLLACVTGIVLFECSCWAQQKSSLSTGIFPFSVRGAWLQFEASQDPLGAH